MDCVLEFDLISFLADVPTDMCSHSVTVLVNVASPSFSQIMITLERI